MVQATSPSTVAETQAAGTVADEGRRRWARVWWIVGGVLLSAGLFVCYVHVSRTQRVESDGASDALQAWDMLHGHLLLRGWVIPDVTFYLTELPEYMLVVLFRGLNADVLHVAAAFTYTLAVAGAALLARGRTRGREGALRMLVAAGIMLAPQPGPGVFLLLFQADHFGTQVPLLATWLILDWAWYGRRRWWVPVVIGVLLTWIGISDQIVSFVGVIPLVVVCGLRAWQQGLRAAWFELSLAAAALASFVMAHAAVRVIRYLGGYRMLPLTSGVISPGELPAHARLWLRGVLGLFGASFEVHPGLPLAFAALHLAGLALAVAGFWLAVRKFHRDDDVIAQLLAVAIVINSLAFLASSRPGAYWGTREIAGLLPMGAVLAGRMIGPRLAAIRTTGQKLGAKSILAIGTLSLVLAGYLTALAWAVTRPPVPADTQTLATWLQAQRATDGLTSYGLSDYGLANTTTLAAGGTVGLRPVISTRAGIKAGPHEYNTTWYTPARHYMNFAVVRVVRGDAYPVSRKELLKAFGPPAHEFRYDHYLIMTWHQNLLTGLKHGAAHKRAGLSPP